MARSHLAVVAGVVLLAGTSSPIVAQTDSLVAFHEQYHEECCRLLLYNYRSGQFESLTGIRSGYVKSHAALSSSKQFLAFNDYTYESTRPSWNVFLYDRFADAMVALPRVNTRFYEGQPALSGNGRYLAFTSNRSGNSDVLLFDRASGKFVALPGLNSAASEGEPSIGGAGGRYIAFSSDRSGKSHVYLYDRSLAKLVSLPGLNASGFYDGGPALSGDDRYIAFHSSRNGDLDVFLYNRTTSRLVPLVGLNSKPAGESPGNDMNPSISGARIAFSTDRGDDHGGHSVVLIYDRSLKAIIAGAGGPNFGEGWDPSLR